MENLKEEEFVDLKAIERKAGGGVKTPHMRMILEALAQVKLKHKTTLHSIFAFLRFQIGHIDGISIAKFQLFQFHGAWLVWFRGRAGMGDKTREEVNFQNYFCEIIFNSKSH